MKGRLEATKDKLCELRSLFSGPPARLKTAMAGNEGDAANKRRLVLSFYLMNLCYTSCSAA